MDKGEFEQRIRQLLAVDINAESLYAHLSSIAEEEELKELFIDISKDEKKHIAASKSILKMLENTQ